MDNIGSIHYTKITCTINCNILRMNAVVWPNSPVWTWSEAWLRAPTVDIIQPDLSSARPKPAGKISISYGSQAAAGDWLQYQWQIYIYVCNSYAIPTISDAWQDALMVESQTNIILLSCWKKLQRHTKSYRHYILLVMIHIYGFSVFSTGKGTTLNVLY